MSNEANDIIKDKIGEEVAKLWCLPARPDLEADCCDYVWEHYDENTIVILVIAFLSTHCANAISSQDLEHMARQYSV